MPQKENLADSEDIPRFFADFVAASRFLSSGSEYAVENKRKALLPPAIGCDSPAKIWVFGNRNRALDRFWLTSYHLTVFPSRISQRTKYMMEHSYRALCLTQMNLKAGSILYNNALLPLFESFSIENASGKVFSIWEQSINISHKSQPDLSV